MSLKYLLSLGIALIPLLASAASTPKVDQCTLQLLVGPAWQTGQTMTVYLCTVNPSDPSAMPSCDSQPLAKFAASSTMRGFTASIPCRDNTQALALSVVYPKWDNYYSSWIYLTKDYPKHLWILDWVPGKNWCTNNVCPWNKP
jgi:hypothetical protein